MDVPWFAKSPSPFSIIFYLILTIYIMKILLVRVKFKRWKYVMAFTDSIFIVGLFVVSLDFIWILVCWGRFGSLYPSSVPNLLTCAARDIAAIILCYFLVGEHFQTKLIKPSKITTLLFIMNIVFLGVWFFLSPSPAYTDWTFAIRYDYPLSTVISSFLISHVVGKSLVAGIIYSTLHYKKLE